MATAMLRLALTCSASTHTLGNACSYSQAPNYGIGCSWNCSNVWSGLDALSFRARSRAVLAAGCRHAAWRTPGNVQLQAATGGCGAARPPSVSLQWPSWGTLNQQGAVVPSSRRAHRATPMQLTNDQRPRGPRHGDHLSKWWHVVRGRQFRPKLVRCGTLPIAIG